MARIFEPSNFPYPLNEEIKAAYDAKAASDKDPESILKRYELKKAVYNISLTLKALCSIGELCDDVRSDMEEYFWRMVS